MRLYLAAAGDEDDDRRQRYKDDLAMGYIYEDGSQREPDPTDYMG